MVWALGKWRDAWGGMGAPGWGREWVEASAVVIAVAEGVGGDVVNIPTKVATSALPVI